MLSKTNFRILDLLMQGDRLSVGRGGTYRFWDSGVPVHYQQVQSLLKQGYIVEGPRGDGKAVIHTEIRITARGLFKWHLIHDGVGEVAYFGNVDLLAVGAAVGNVARSEF